MRQKTANFKYAETIEAERSEIDAQLHGGDLFIHDYRRYLNPPANTPYPLEYAYFLLGEVRGKRVLDFGCGAGENSALLAIRGAETCGIDISPELIALAKKRCRLHGIEADLRVASCHDSGLPSQSFDVVFGAAILHHLDLDLALSETARLLKLGGFAIFSEPIRDSRLAKVARRIFPPTAPDISPLERPFATQELFSAGMKMKEIRKFRLPHIAVLGEGYRWAWTLDRWLLRRFPLEHWASTMVWRANFDQESAASQSYPG